MLERKGQREIYNTGGAMHESKREEEEGKSG